MNTAVATKPEDEASARVPQPARRFILPDLQDCGQWLIARLRAKYPHLQDRQIHTWIYGLSNGDSREYLFIRNDKAVAMAQLHSDLLWPSAYVREVFVLAMNEITKDSPGTEEIESAADLYADIDRWAFGIGASRLYIENFTDCPRVDIQMRLRRTLTTETVKYAKVGK